jgi:hypothetical protein
MCYVLGHANTIELHKKKQDIYTSSAVRSSVVAVVARMSRSTTTASHLTHPLLSSSLLTLSLHPDPGRPRPRSHAAWLTLAPPRATIRQTRPMPHLSVSAQCTRANPSSSTVRLDCLSITDCRLQIAGAPLTSTSTLPLVPW